jgi:hypothetical protein
MRYVISHGKRIAVETLEINRSQNSKFHRPAHNANALRHIGCPLSWFKRVLPVVRGKNELAVALYIYRLRIVQHSQTVVVSNAPLLSELGIDRFAKHRALRRLAAAGIISLKQINKRAITIVFP